MRKKRSRGNGQGSLFQRGGSGFWIAKWYDATGKRREYCTKTFDKQTAQRLLAAKIAGVALRRDGIIDVRQEAVATEAGKTIAAHLAQFETKMRARQAGESHVSRTLFFIREVCNVAGFTKASDIHADQVDKIIVDMQAEGKAPRTIQGRVVAMKSFSKWLADNGRLARDPLRGVKRPSIETDRRLRRRMLLPAEWPYLRAATLASGAREAMSPLDRVALYATAIQTGLRSSELRSLTKADLFLASDKPFVRCKAENTKNHKVARQYIQADLAEELRRLAANKTPATPVFPMPEEWKLASMLRADLAAARSRWFDEVKHDPNERARREESDFLVAKNDQGEALDFHAMRHTCGSWLAIQGVHPGVIRQVMRHSTITLTMDTYGHLLPDQHAQAIGGMAEMLGSGSLAATGTVGGCPPVDPPVGVRNSAKQCHELKGGEGQDVPGGFPEILEISRGNPQEVRQKPSSRGRTRTGTALTGQGILSPQCLPFHHAAGNHYHSLS
jgi:integrase